MGSKRIPHHLRKNKLNYVPRKFVVFDTETYPEQKDGKEIHHFRLAVAYYFNNQRGFSDQPSDKIITQNPHELWDWITSKICDRERLWVFAHNADFDMTTSRAYEYLQKHDWDLQHWIVEDRMFHIRLRKGRKTLVISDTFSLFPMSLEKIGRWVGHPKMKMPSWDSPLEEWIRYCENDVYVTSLALLKYFKFIKDNDLGNFRPTISGQAFTAFRHRFMKHDIYIHHFPNVEGAEIQGYYGGRTEAWYIGKVKEKIFYLDINSMYPYVMKYREYPVRFLNHLDNPTLNELRRLCKKFCVVAHIHVDTSLPILPYRSSKTIFPVGKFSGWYCTPEVQLALEKGFVVKCDKVYIYQKAPIFVDYVDFFYNLKRQGKQNNDMVSYVMSKLYLNSLYGKFGQRIEELRELKDGELSLEESEENLVSMATGKIHIYEFMGKKYIKERKEPSYNSFIGIAAHVSSYARVHLWRMIEKAGIENVYYMDTDSLFVNEEGYRRLQDEISDYELGKLKIEKIGTNVEIYGAKNYRFNQERKLKGVPKSARQIDDNRYEYLHFMKFKTKLRRGLLNEQIGEMVVKEISGDYDKGIITNTGRVIPLQIFEQQRVFHQL